MSDSTPPQHDEDSRSEGRPDFDSKEREDLDSLKAILFREEKAQLDAIRHELREAGVDKEKLSQLLPAAVRSAAGRDEKLAKSLSPLIGSALHASIKNNPESIVEAISPIMGPAIRDAIRQALRSMMQSLNKTLEYSVSAKGMKWRWEAFTTGKSFAEVVLLHTLLFRVEQLFLIHRETGLLIQHVTMDDELGKDADLASSMLTAIQDFARDSFGVGDDESLRTVAIGAQTIWIQTGYLAYLAAVIEGEAPSSLRVQLQECLETMHVDYADALQDFNGDDRPFETAKALLSDCLLTAYEHDEKTADRPAAAGIKRQTSRGTKWWWTITTLGILAGLWWLSTSFIQQRRLAEVRRLLAIPPTVTAELDNGLLRVEGKARQQWIDEIQHLATRLPNIDSLETSGLVNLDQPWNDYVDQLRNEPGIIVTSADSREGRYTIEGLMDPLASDPQQIMNQWGIDSSLVESNWTPFTSNLTDIEIRRFVDRLKLPPNVVMTVRDNVLVFEGVATTDWLNQIKQFISLELGNQITIDVKRLQLDIADQSMSLARRDQLIKEIDHHTIYFDAAASRLEDGQEQQLTELTEQLTELLNASERMKTPLRITIVGYAKRGIPTNINDPLRLAQELDLAQERARVLWRELIQRGVPDSESLRIQGKAGNAVQDRPNSVDAAKANRCCIFRTTAR